MKLWIGLIIGVLGFVVLVWCALNVDISRYEKRNGFKRLSSTVAEKASYFYGGEKFPRATCSACRTGKIKLGHFSLGGLNTIEFDDLVLNLPPDQKINYVPSPAKSSDKPAPVDVKGAKSDVFEQAFESLGISSLAKSFGKSHLKYSGIKINRLELNKMDGDALKPILKAKTLRNQRDKLLLSGATIYRNEAPEYVESAVLEYKSGIRLVWAGGSWDNFIDF